MSNSALFRFYCEATPVSTTSSSSSTSDTETETYDDSATSTSTAESTDTANLLCHVTVSDKSEDTKPGASTKNQLMELLFDIYCLLNGFFRSLLDSNCPSIRVKCQKRDPEMAILDILQRIVDREILVDEKCKKYPALIPMLTAINKKFQSAEGLFSDAVEESASGDLMSTIIESVENIQNYFECMKVANGTEKEVESDLQEIICYIDCPLNSEKKSPARC